MAAFLDFVNLVDELLDSSTDDSEEETVLLTDSTRKSKIPKMCNYVEEVVSMFNDVQFKSHFRVKQNTCYAIITKFENSQFYPNVHKGGTISVSAESHILSFLWFAGNKCTIREVSDRFNMSLSTFYLVQSRVISFLIDLLPTVIRFPKTETEKSTVSANFREISGFPNVLGCIDGTYIQIRTPAHRLKSTYTNRHDVPSITLQGICDANKRFLDVFTGPPGKIHDSRIFKLSFISTDIHNLTNNGHYHLLGDSAYPIREWLLTPFKDYGNLTREQKNYNRKLSATRVKIENAFGLLKGRFRQLHRLDFHNVLKMSQFTLACCVLHNICIDYNDTCEDVVVENNYNNIAVFDSDTELRRLGDNKRGHICTLICN